MNERFMAMALEEAEKAFLLGEVPVGALIVKDGEIIAKSHNLCETQKDATAHAEILAIREASQKLNRWRLDDCDLYVTLEPCAMCSGAIQNARLRRLYFGAFEPNTGACCSCMNLFLDTQAYKSIDIYPNVLEADCRRIMQKFFADRRKD